MSRPRFKCISRASSICERLKEVSLESSEDHEARTVVALHLDAVGLEGLRYHSYRDGDFVFALSPADSELPFS